MSKLSVSKKNSVEKYPGSIDMAYYTCRSIIICVGLTVKKPLAR